jgi:hypothetical protein
MIDVKTIVNSYRFLYSTVIHQKDVKVISRFTTQILYVKVKENILIIKSIKSGETITLEATTPFSTKRLLIGQFSIVEKLLKSGFDQLSKSILSPIVIMHPLENIDDKLSEVEEKVLKELALSAGAREVKLWVGKELTDEELLNV